MSDRDDNRDTPVEQGLKDGSSSSAKRKHWRPLLVLFLAFVGIVTLVFLTRTKEAIDWVQDYEEGLRQARQQGKPVLLAFYRSHTRFCSLMTQNTYNDPVVKKYVEQNFIPIFIDVDKQPIIAQRYDIQYYPTHYVKHPDSDNLVGPHMGYDVPQEFIKILQGFLEKLNAPER